MSAEPTTPTRERTRRAILDAAGPVLAADPAAPLPAVASASGVGRTTVHRYFPERADLVRALARHVFQETDARVARARPDVGPPLDALRRVADALFDLGPVLTYLYGEPAVLADEECRALLESDHDPVRELLERTAPLLRPGLSTAWVRRVFWSLLYTGWETAREDGTPRHEVVDAMMTTFATGVVADPGLNPGPRAGRTRSAPATSTRG